MTYMQTLWTPTGYVLEYQEGTLARHFRTVSHALSAEDVIAAFRSYAAGESAWRSMFEYRLVKVGSRWYHAAYAIGRAWGGFRVGFAEARAVNRVRPVKRILWGGLAAVVVWIVCVAWQIAAYGSRHDPAPADVAIVLGAAVRGTEPSPVFAARIDHAVSLYRRGRVGRIVFTGGTGAGDSIAESEAARRYAIRAGVPDGRIAVETRSRITYGNLLEARALLSSVPAPRVLIVSDPLHMRRAVTMARDLGLDAHPAPTPTSRYRSWRTRAGFLGREVFFYSQYLVQRLFA